MRHNTAIKLEMSQRTFVLGTVLTNWTRLSVGKGSNNINLNQVR